MVQENKDVSMRGFSKPFILKESKVFKSQVIDTIKLMKSFRNRLVHRYGDIDNKLAYHNIKDGLKDFQMMVSI